MEVSVLMKLTEMMVLMVVQLVVELIAGIRVTFGRKHFIYRKESVVGVDVMITISCDCCQFLANKMEFFLKNKWCDHLLLYFLVLKQGSGNKNYAKHIKLILNYKTYCYM
jgi:hypothetical protein